MKTGGCTLPYGIQTVDDLQLTVEYLPNRIGGDSAHVIMIARMDRAQLFLGIEIEIFSKKTGHLGDLVEVHGLRKMAQIDPHMLYLVIGV